MFTHCSLQILFIVNFVFIQKSLVIECNCNTFAYSTIWEKGAYIVFNLSFSWSVSIDRLSVV